MIDVTSAVLMKSSVLHMRSIGSAMLLLVQRRTIFVYEAPICFAEASAASRIDVSQVAGGSEFTISMSTSVCLPIRITASIVEQQEGGDSLHLLHSVFQSAPQTPRFPRILITGCSKAGTSAC